MNLDLTLQGSINSTPNASEAAFSPDDLKTGQLTICPSYQKKYSIKTDRIIGIEIYGRLKDKENNIFPPAKFIPELKKYHLLSDFSWQLFSSVVDKWQEHEMLEQQLSISLNLDTESLADETLLAHLIERNASFSQQTEVLLDFDYTQLSTASPNELENLKVLCTLGYKLSVEVDVGTDKLEEMINNLPISEIKLKRHLFVHSLSNSQMAKEMSVIISIAAKSSIPVTVIGIETEEQYQHALQNDISNIQGFYIGEEQKHAEIFAELNDIFGQNEQEQIINNQNRVLCFSNDESFDKAMDVILSARYNKHYHPLKIDEFEIVDVSYNDIIVFDLNDLDDVKIAQQLFHQLGEHFYSLVLVPPVDDPQLRLDFLDMGSFDVLEKPVVSLEMLAKVERMSTYIKHFQQVHQKVEETETLAFQSMQDASSYGQIIRFMKDVSSCLNHEDLASVFFNYMENQGLHCSIFVTNGDVEHTYCPHGINCTPAEYKVYNLLRSDKRLHEFHGRLVVNDKNISFLIKNMPEDENHRGRIRDYVAIVAECIQEKAVSLFQTQGIETAINELADISSYSINAIQHAKSIRHELLDKVCNDISMSFHTLDLSLEQEDYLTDIIKEALDNSEIEDDTVNATIDRISIVTEKLQTLAAMANGKHQNEKQQDIELF